MTRNIIDLPLDVFGLIRIHLVTVPIDGNVDLLEQSQSGWRHFLSVSKNQHWSDLRKCLMIWSLNRYKSEKYFRNEYFRSYLVDRMNRPDQQLHCSLVGRKFTALAQCTLDFFAFLDYLEFLNCLHLTVFKF
jgi:hypothetical protein